MRLPFILTRGLRFLFLIPKINILFYPDYIANIFIRHAIMYSLHYYKLPYRVIFRYIIILRNIRITTLHSKMFRNSFPLYVIHSLL